MSPAPDADAAMPYLDPPIDQDRPCRACGYNLRGLATRGECPECGEDIALSLSNQVLAGAHPEWIRKVHRGSVFIFAAVLTVIALPFGGGCLFAFMAENNWTSNAMGWVLIAWLAAGWVLALSGTWLITTPSHDTLKPYPPLIYRWAALVGIGVGPVFLFAILIAVIAIDGFHLSEPWLQTLACLGSLGLGLGKAALYLNYRHLGLRMRDPALTRAATILVVILTVGTADLVFLLLTAVFDTRLYWRSDGLFEILACSLPLIFILAMLWQLILTDAFRDRLNRARPHRDYRVNDRK